MEISISFYSCRFHIGVCARPFEQLKITLIFKLAESKTIGVDLG